MPFCQVFDFWQKKGQNEMLKKTMKEFLKTMKEFLKFLHSFFLITVGVLDENRPILVNINLFLVNSLFCLQKLIMVNKS
jgi:hypothetical protein